MKDFIDFIRKQGVVGLAIGFILGGAVSNLVSALVQDVINPVIGIFLGPVGNLAYAKIMEIVKKKSPTNCSFFKFNVLTGLFCCNYNQFAQL